MKYAREVIELMGAYPGRPFRLGELVRHVSRGRDLDKKERTRLERGIQRAMEALEETGSITIHEPEEGRHGRNYIWHVTDSSHRPHKSVTRYVTMGAG